MWVWCSQGDQECCEVSGRTVTVRPQGTGAQQREGQHLQVSEQNLGVGHLDVLLLFQVTSISHSSHHLWLPSLAWPFRLSPLPLGHTHLLHPRGHFVLTHWLLRPSAYSFLATASWIGCYNRSPPVAQWLAHNSLAWVCPFAASGSWKRHQNIFGPGDSRR